jgi:hypothetical protein
MATTTHFEFDPSISSVIKEDGRDGKASPNGAAQATETGQRE